MAAWGGLRRVVFWIEQHGDVALAVAMSVAGVVEAILEANTVSENRFPPATLLVTVPLAWRRRWPMVVLALVFLGAIISREAPGVEIASAAIAAYSVGAHERRRVLGTVELLACAFIVLAVFGGRLPPLPDFAGPFAVVVPLWLVGNAIRQGRMRAEAFSERARTLEQEQLLTAKAAQAEERARLALELHDVVAHSVSVMVVQAGAARKVVEQSPERAGEALRAVEETGREAMKELRQILGVLGDSEPALDPQPSLNELGALVRSVREAGLPVELQVTGAARALAPSIELTAYRIVQEALTNALKHSGMAATRVTVDYRQQELTVEVLSDAGAAATPSTEGGRGLSGMDERVARLGGRLEAGPRIDRGYAVRAWLPMETL